MHTFAWLVVLAILTIVVHGLISLGPENFLLSVAAASTSTSFAYTLLMRRFEQHDR